MTLTENGLTAFSDVITACRPCYPGHYNNRPVNLKGITLHTIESKRQLGNRIMAGPPGSNGGILGDNWLNQRDVESSVHAGTDDTDRVQGLSLDRQCWGAGAHGNSLTWQIEQAGDADMSRAEWLAPQAMRVLDNTAQVVAAMIREAANRGVIIPVRFATPQQVLDAANGGAPFGLTQHKMWSKLFPQDTSHTDCGDGYPEDVVIALVNKYLGRGNANVPPNTPTQVPTAPPAPPKEWSDMASEAEFRQIAGEEARKVSAADDAEVWSAFQAAQNADAKDKGNRLATVINNLAHRLRPDGRVRPIDQK